MNVLPVAELCFLIRESLESDPRFADVWVEGELSNVSRAASGHIYFTLKDSGGAMRCAFFRRDNAKSRAAMQNGAQVVAHGRVSLYEPRGDLQLIVDFAADAGQGILNLQFERLKERLAEEGLFEEGRKRPLPVLPRRIGLITSAGGAVLHDICNVLRRRWPLVEVVLAPTLVQGDGSVEGVVNAFALLGHLAGVDLIIVARGGGSLEDLWTFNEEAVARAIFASPVPVISAIGHETDFTIADFVADLRAPTPSVAAELAVPDQREVSDRLEEVALSLGELVAARLREFRGEVTSLRDRVQRRRPDISALRRDIADQQRWGREFALRAVRSRIAELGNRYAQLHALSPHATLARGYAVVQVDGGGPTVTSVRDVTAGDQLRIAVADGVVGATVRTVQ